MLRQRRRDSGSASRRSTTGAPVKERGTIAGKVLRRLGGRQLGRRGAGDSGKLTVVAGVGRDHRGRPARSGGVSVVVLAGALAACSGASGETETGETGATTGGATATTGDLLPPPPMAADTCLLAPTVDAGRFFGTLRDIPSGVGVCNVDGPTTYLRIATELDVDVIATANAAGFTPRLGIAPDSCVADRELACSEGSTVELRDVSAGTVLTLSIGAAADDPGLLVEMPEPGVADPLDFSVDVGFRQILDLGERCQPESRGRCPTGSLCAPPEESEAEELTTWVCEALEGDTCASAETVVLGEASGALEVDLSAPQTDAHAHPCMGEGLRERVLRLVIDAPLPPAAMLVLETKAEVGLAVRAPGCAAAAGVACTVPGENASVTVALGGVDPFLFIEWAEAGEIGAEPIVLTWQILGE